jgi:hypothetical protein
MDLYHSESCWDNRAFCYFSHTCCLVASRQIDMRERGSRSRDIKTSKIVSCDRKIPAESKKPKKNTIAFEPFHQFSYNFEKSVSHENTPKFIEIKNRKLETKMAGDAIKYFHDESVNKKPVFLQKCGEILVQQCRISKCCHLKGR